MLGATFYSLLRSSSLMKPELKLSNSELKLSPLFTGSNFFLISPFRSHPTCFAQDKGRLIQQEVVMVIQVVRLFVKPARTVVGNYTELSVGETHLALLRRRTQFLHVSPTSVTGLTNQWLRIKLIISKEIIVTFSLCLKQQKYMIH